MRRIILIKCLKCWVWYLLRSGLQFCASHIAHIYRCPAVAQPHAIIIARTVSAPISIGARARLIINYPPAWHEHYMTRRYDTFDPISHRFQCDPDPFEWSAIFAGGSSFGQAFFGEAGSFSIRFGLNVPLHYWHGRFAAVTFASDIQCAATRAGIRKNSRDVNPSL